MVCHGSRNQMVVECILQMLILQLVLGILMTVNKMVKMTGIVVDGLEHRVVTSQLELEDGSELVN